MHSERNMRFMDFSTGATTPSASSAAQPHLDPQLQRTMQLEHLIPPLTVPSSPSSSAPLSVPAGTAPPVSESRNAVTARSSAYRHRKPGIQNIIHQAHSPTFQVARGRAPSRGNGSGRKRAASSSPHGRDTPRSEDHSDAEHPTSVHQRPTDQTPRAHTSSRDRMARLEGKSRQLVDAPYHSQHSLPTISTTTTGTEDSASVPAANAPSSSPSPPLHQQVGPSPPLAFQESTSHLDAAALKTLVDLYEVRAHMHTRTFDTLCAVNQPPTLASQFHAIRVRYAVMARPIVLEDQALCGIRRTKETQLLNEADAIWAKLRALDSTGARCEKERTQLRLALSEVGQDMTLRSRSWLVDRYWCVLRTEKMLGRMVNEAGNLLTLGEKESRGACLS
jgi:hypothetical protein